MNTRKNNKEFTTDGLEKVLTGIRGFDEITGGGLPACRPTLVYGGPGCGKTLLGMEFIVNGAVRYDEPGVFMAFEENEEELSDNFRSFGINLPKLVEEKKILLDYVKIERSGTWIAGDYDLDGLFKRIENSVDAIGAKRIVLDNIESYLSGLPSLKVIQSEIHRLFRWLRDQKLTALITGEAGTDLCTRYGVSEYLADCVIHLDNHISGQSSIRRFRITKYRGSAHGTIEYPFLIDDTGFSFYPVTTAGLNHVGYSQRISSGIPHLDAMLDGQGYFRGSTVMVSGMPGTGKSSLAAHMASHFCREGKRVLYFAFEEASHQIIRNMKSIGLDMGKYQEEGTLKFHPVRPGFMGLEMLLTSMIRITRDFTPDLVIIDPVTSILEGNTLFESKAMLVRLLDFLKMDAVTTLLTAQTAGRRELEPVHLQLSPLTDTIVLLSENENNGERSRWISVIKSRGMNHSNHTREFMITRKGILFCEQYFARQITVPVSANGMKKFRARTNGIPAYQENVTKMPEFIAKKFPDGRVEHMD